MKGKEKSALIWEGVPKGFSDLDDLRRIINEFTFNNTIKILSQFYHDGDSKHFAPKKNKKNELKYDVANENKRPGCFSTVFCLETLGLYKKSIEAYDKKIGFDEVERKCFDDVKTEENAVNFLKYILDNGLATECEAVCSNKTDSSGFLMCTTMLVPFAKYLESCITGENTEVRDYLGDFLIKFDKKSRYAINKIIITSVVDFAYSLNKDKTSIHPFVMYRFMQFLDYWRGPICAAFNEQRELEKVIQGGTDTHTGDGAEAGDNAGEAIKRSLKEKYEECLEKKWIATRDELDAAIHQGNTTIKKCELFVDKFKKEIYLFAKYEMYRQLSLYYAGDLILYDVKRLIYALLLVYRDDKFTNNLIRDQALELIFESMKKDSNALWPSGQLIRICHDNMMTVNMVQCIYDLLNCKYLHSSLNQYQAELKCIYDFYSRNLQVDSSGNPLGWFWHDIREKRVRTFKTALVLSFLNKYTAFLTECLRENANAAFKVNYRTPDIKWEDLLDSTAAKSKVRLMAEFKKDEEGNPSEPPHKPEIPFKTAILFGPPGTGKTTYARALATKLKWSYLELTPGDFFSGGELKILETINSTFHKLKYLTNTVVFIDEVDDLVRSREPAKTDGAGGAISLHAYDPRSLYVNMLLPRFQELHDKGNIIMIFASNHYEHVDEAIARLGRIDLIIPIGAVSPYSRLKYLYSNSTIGEAVNGMHGDQREELCEAFLKKTENYTYPLLKLLMKKIDSEIMKKGKEQIASIIKDEKVSISGDSSVEKFTEDGLRQHEENRDRHWKTARPQVCKGDFEDYKDMDTAIRRKFLESFAILQKRSGVIVKEAGQVHNFVQDISKMTDKPFNLITSAYDDMEMLCDGAHMQKEMAKTDDNTRKEEIKSVNAKFNETLVILKGMINERPMI